MKYDPNDHIAGKVYDLTQENMQAMLQHIENLIAFDSVELAFFNLYNRPMSPYSQPTIAVSQELYETLLKKMENDKKRNLI